MLKFLIKIEFRSVELIGEHCEFMLRGFQVINSMTRGFQGILLVNNILMRIDLEFRKFFL